MRTIRILFVIAALFFASDVSAVDNVKKNTTPKPRSVSSPQTILKAELYKSFEKSKIDAIFADERLVLDKTVITGGAGGGPTYTYFEPEFGLLSQRALQTGLDFWNRNRSYFGKATELYGVDAAAVLGIVRIETYFGRATGKRSVFNSLYSVYALSSKQKKRTWALGEIKSFLRIVEREGWDVFEVYGSTAGAFGIPQFIPSSYLGFAVDGNNDGAIDLFSEPDAIMSAARYLKDNGWGEAVGDRKKAVLAYNHSTSYTNAVLLYMSAMDFIITRETSFVPPIR